MTRKSFIAVASTATAVSIVTGIVLVSQPSPTVRQDTKSTLSLSAPQNELFKARNKGSDGAFESEEFFAPPWSKPFGDAPFAITVHSLDEAQAKLTFKMTKPKTFTPDTIQVAPDGHAVGFAFNLPEYGGWVQLVEHATKASPDDYVSALLGPRYSKGSIENGKFPTAEGVLNGAANINWVDSGVAFDIAGETLSHKQARSLISELFY